MRLKIISKDIAAQLLKDAAQVKHEKDIAAANYYSGYVQAVEDFKRAMQQDFGAPEPTDAEKLAYTE